MIVHVLAGQNGGSAGRAQGRRHKGVFEVDSLLSQLVDIRCIDNRIHESQLIESLIVSQDVNDVDIGGGSNVTLGFGAQFCSRFNIIAAGEEPPC